MGAGNRKLKYALDEGRILVIGTQVLLGFEYRSFFEHRYEALPGWAKAAKLATVCVMLTGFALIVLPSAYHRLAADGGDGPDVHRVARLSLGLALLPLGGALGLDLTFAVRAVLGDVGAWVAGALGAGAAVGAWYGFTGLVRRASGRRASSEDTMAEPSKLPDRITHVLTELRTVLPGAQALLGFGLAVTLVEPFAALPRSSQLVHLGALGCETLAVVALVLPAAFHRIVERGEETERMVRLAGGLLLAGMALVAAGLSLDLYVVARKVLHDPTPAAVTAAAAGAAFLALWFVLPLAARARRARRGAPARSSRRPAAAER
jgi:hypothetical protein